MQLTYSIPFLTLLPVLNTALAPTQVVYEAPNGTWFENLAVRACGSIIPTTVISLTSGSSIHSPRIHPESTPTTLQVFPSGLETLGVTETAPDTFQVVV